MTGRVKAGARNPPGDHIWHTVFIRFDIGELVRARDDLQSIIFAERGSFCRPVFMSPRRPRSIAKATFMSYERIGMLKGNQIAPLDSGVLCFVVSFIAPLVRGFPRLLSLHPDRL